MSKVKVSNLEVQKKSSGHVEFSFHYQFNPTETEKRLKIPSTLYARFMEKDIESKPDEIKLYANFRSDFDGVNDDTVNKDGTTWFKIGSFSENKQGTYSKQFSTSIMPKDFRWDDVTLTEKWYCILMARPDIKTELAYSNVETLNI